jgi:hypothetical protein
MLRCLSITYATLGQVAPPPPPPEPTTRHRTTTTQFNSTEFDGLDEAEEEEEEGEEEWEDCPEPKKPEQALLLASFATASQERNTARSLMEADAVLLNHVMVISRGRAPDGGGCSAPQGGRVA